MNNHNLAEVAAKIKILKGLDLSDLSFEDAKDKLYGFSLPHNTWKQEPGVHVFRGQVNDNGNPFDSICRISYKKEPSDYIQRASLPGDIIFYASDGIDVVAHEAIQDAIRKTDKKTFFVTVGKWRINNPLQIMLICHNEEALESGTDLGKALPGLEQEMRKTHKYPWLISLC